MFWRPQPRRVPQWLATWCVYVTVRILYVGPFILRSSRSRMMNRQCKLLYCMGLVCVLAVLASSCETTGSSGAANRDPVQRATGLAPHYSPPVADIPLPRQFSLVESESFSSIAGTMRDVAHTYAGKADPLAVVRFYKDQMPANSWIPLGERFRGGEWSLHYQKDNETCQICVYRSNLSTKITVDIFSLDRLPSSAESGTIQGRRSAQ